MMSQAIPDSSYCSVAPGHPLHGPYHDREYGFPLTDDDALFERLVLEINQAELSWATIVRKQEGFRRAYAGFRVAEVAAFDEADRNRLVAGCPAYETIRRLDPLWMQILEGTGR